MRRRQRQKKFLYMSLIHVAGVLLKRGDWDPADTDRVRTLQKDGIYQPGRKPSAATKVGNTPSLDLQLLGLSRRPGGVA